MNTSRPAATSITPTATSRSGTSTAAASTTATSRPSPLTAPPSEPCMTAGTSPAMNCSAPSPTSSAPALPAGPKSTTPTTSSPANSTAVNVAAMAAAPSAKRRKGVAPWLVMLNGVAASRQLPPRTLRLTIRRTIGLSQSQWHRLCRSKHPPDLRMLVMIALAIRHHPATFLWKVARCYSLPPLASTSEGRSLMERYAPLFLGKSGEAAMLLARGIVHPRRAGQDLVRRRRAAYEEDQGGG